MTEQSVFRQDHQGIPPKELVGGKGRSLFQLNEAGARVPAFFVISTEAWRRWRDSGELPPELVEEIRAGVGYLEDTTGATFGGGPIPLLLSVRSAGAASMPGMMDTVLDLGITPSSLAAIYEQVGDIRVMRDVVSTFIGTMAPVLGGSDGVAIPSEAYEQLFAAVTRVFISWDNDRARLYRRMNKLDDDLGTAVVVQAMVLGNRGSHSGSGVFFTRDVLTGEASPMGEWAPQHQGEVVVSGSATPESTATLTAELPEVSAELHEIGRILERRLGWPQDIEFTVQEGELFLLQTRDLRCSELATCRIASDLVETSVIDPATAAERLATIDLEKLALEEFVRPGPASADVIGNGIGAAPGIRTGVVVRSTEQAQVRARIGEQVVLVRPETSPQDLAGMRVATAVVTERGGATSHAAIVARELGIPGVTGCGPLTELTDGLIVTVDGTSGQVLSGQFDVCQVEPPVVAQARRIIAGSDQNEEHSK